MPARTSCGDVPPARAARVSAPEVKRRIMLGTYALSAGYYDAYYGQAQKVRTLIKRDFEQAFEQVDVIAAPGGPDHGFPDRRARRRSRWRCTWRTSSPCPPTWPACPGWPSRSGSTAQGLPVGMQLMGPHFGEDAPLPHGARLPAGDGLAPAGAKPGRVREQICWQIYRRIPKSCWIGRGRRSSPTTGSWLPAR